MPATAMPSPVKAATMEAAAMEAAHVAAASVAAAHVLSHGRRTGQSSARRQGRDQSQPHRPHPPTAGQIMAREAAACLDLGLADPSFQPIADSKEHHALWASFNPGLGQRVL
jgi:hypothetical protein